LAGEAGEHAGEGADLVAGPCLGRRPAAQDRP
jgi:hypothetical protein